jgi:hypothetical protein
MTEGKKRPARVGLSPATGVATSRDEDAERLLGRVVAGGLPVVCVAAAVIVGSVASVGSALLVLASGALIGAIALLWASVRTLSGDAPLPTDLEILAAQSHDVDGLAEHKRRVLRALKDLESEHAIGKIDRADYEEIAARYRDDAKAVMREMDAQVAPALAEAERRARQYIAAHGGARAGRDEEPAESEAADAPVASTAERVDRRRCTSCDTSNERDAAFCKKCGATMHLEANDATT